MKTNNANVFVCSLLKVNKRLAHYGEADISHLTLLKLIYKYADYSESSDTLIRLDTLVSELQLSQDDICINMVSGDFYPDKEEPFGEGNENTAPTLDNGAITLTDTDLIHIFDGSQFEVNFADADGDLPGDIIIYSLPVKGELFIGTTPVVQYQVIDIYSNLQGAPLTYYRDDNDNGAYAEPFTFVRVDDNADNPAQSLVKTMNVTVTALANSESSIGDETVYTTNQAITVLTQAMVAPSYSDPDGDDLDAIRIDEISDANQGVFKYNGNPVGIGQIISAADLGAGLFTHEGPVSLIESSDVFGFSVRDVGSLIWVS